MPDGVKKIGDARLADAVVKAYAGGFGGITDEECAGIGLDTNHCKLLQKIIQPVDIEDGWGFGSRKGSIFWDDINVLTSNFSDEFVNALMGEVGYNMRPLKARVRWLSENSVTRFFRTDATDDERIRMIKELACYGAVAEEAVPSLIEALNDDASRLWAIRALGAIGPKAKAAIPSLSDLIRLDDRASEISGETIEALGHIGLPSDETLQRIFRYLEVRFANKTESISNGDFFDYLPYYVAGFGGPILPYLKNIIKRGRLDDLLYFAVLVIREIKAEKRDGLSDFIPDLVALLKKDANHSIVAGTIHALKNIGIQEGEKKPQITEHLIDYYFENGALLGDYYNTTSWALIFQGVLPEMLTPETVSDLITSYLNRSIGNEWQDPNSRIGFAIRSLRDVFAHIEVAWYEQEKVLQMVIERLESSPDRFKGVWLDVIGRLDKEMSKDAIPVVVETFHNSSDPYARFAAMNAIGNIGICDQDVIDAVMAGLVDEDPKVNERSVAAFRTFISAFKATPDAEGLLHYAIPLLTAVRDKFLSGSDEYRNVDSLISQFEEEEL